MLGRTPNAESQKDARYALSVKDEIKDDEVKP
jgi:hypothetical protein